MGLLEPLRRGSVRGRGCGEAGGAYGFTGWRCLVRHLGRLLASLFQRLCPGSLLECLFGGSGSILSSFWSLFGYFLRTFQGLLH